MSTLEKLMGRARKHTTPMLREEVLRAVHEEIDLDDLVDEVRGRAPVRSTHCLRVHAQPRHSAEAGSSCLQVLTTAYMTKHIVQKCDLVRARALLHENLTNMVTLALRHTWKEPFLKTCASHGSSWWRSVVSVVERAGVPSTCVGSSYMSS